MKKTTVTVVVIILVSSIAVVGYYLFKNQQTAGVDGVQEAAMMQEPGQTETMPASQKYVAYSDSALANAAGKRVVLFFYANWCPICRPADAEIGKNTAKIPDDVVIVRVNYNDSDTDAAEQALANKYGITYQHTFVLLDTNGNEVDKWSGGGLKDILNHL